MMMMKSNTQELSMLHSSDDMCQRTNLIGEDMQIAHPNSFPETATHQNTKSAVSESGCNRDLFPTSSLSWRIHWPASLRCWAVLLGCGGSRGDVELDSERVMM